MGHAETPRETLSPLGRGEQARSAVRVRASDLSGKCGAPSPGAPIGATRPLPTGERVAAATASRKTEHARRLRLTQTDPERLLWSRLRARRLCGWEFRRQTPIGRYVVDFCCPDAWLVIELDGGGHTRDDAIRQDVARSREIEAAGYLLIRFWNREVIDNLDGICDTILAQIEARA